MVLPVVAQPSCLTLKLILNMLPPQIQCSRNYHQSKHLRSCPFVEVVACLHSLELPDIMNLEIHRIWVSSTESL